MHWKMVVLLLPFKPLLCQCCNVGMHLPLLLSQLLSLPSPVNPTVSNVAPVAANTAFDNVFDIAMYSNRPLYWC